MKRTLVLLSLALSSMANPCAIAQPYTFSKSTQTYTEISAVANSFLQSPKFSDTIALGFNLKIAGVTGNKLYVNKRGTISTSGGLITDPYFETFSAEHSMGAYTYSITGTAGNHIAVLQFKNIKFDHDFTSSDYMNFQVWLYEADNIIEIHFGPSAVNNPTESYYYNLGGPAIGTSGYWLSGPASAPVTSATMGTRITGTPANGTVYKFTNGTTSVAQHSGALKLKLHPVPATNILYIDGASANTTYSIYNTHGATVVSKMVYNNGIDIRGLPSGNYLLQVETNNTIPVIRFSKE